jgi:GNAT superfamily N-acetyltransferase
MQFAHPSSAPWDIAALNPQEAPWHLLLAADPSRDKVLRYLRACTGFAARETTPSSPQGRGAIFGICLLTAAASAEHEEADPGTSVDWGSGTPDWEIMNIAVAPAWQRQGMGGALLQEAIAWARRQGAKQLVVGTGSFGDQLLFYQRAGFRVSGLQRDFFLRNYTTQLWERGAQHKDMLRLTLDL